MGKFLLSLWVLVLVVATGIFWARVASGWHPMEGPNRVAERMAQEKAQRQERKAREEAEARQLLEQSPALAEIAGNLEAAIRHSRQNKGKDGYRPFDFQTSRINPPAAATAASRNLVIVCTQTPDGRLTLAQDAVWQGRVVGRAGDTLEQLSQYQFRLQGLTFRGKVFYRMERGKPTYTCVEVS